MEPLALLDGHLVPQSQARLALNDAGFVFGATVTDLCRTFRRRPYRWVEHLSRFRRGCERIDIRPTCTDAQLTAWADELLRHNGALLAADAELALVLFATPGPIGYYLGLPCGVGDAPPTFGMHTFPLPFERYRPLVERGADLVVPEVRHVPPECVDRRIKQRSRLHWWLADRAARRLRPGVQALLRDDDGTLTETAAANFLIVRSGAVISPPAERILGGVSLGVVRELCDRLGIAFREESLTLDTALTAEEALLTSTPYGLVGVRRLQDREYACPGPITQRLLAAWNAAVGLDIHGQIRAE